MIINAKWLSVLRRSLLLRKMISFNVDLFREDDEEDGRKDELTKKMYGIFLKYGVFLNCIFLNCII